MTTKTKTTTSKSKTPVFTLEQLDFLLMITAEPKLTIHSSHAEFVAAQVYKGFRDGFLAIKEKQHGYR